jgi:hypothetical protein
MDAYYIILPVLAIAFFIAGALHRFLLVLPEHLFPMDHLWATRRAKQLDDDTTTVKVSYAVAQLVLTGLVLVAAWLPYELVVMLLGGASIGAPLAGTLCAPLAVVAFLLPPVLMCSARSDVWGAGGRQPTPGEVTKVMVQLVADAVLVTLPTVLTAYFARDFDWTWMAAAIVWVVLVLYGIIMYYCARPSESKRTRARRLATAGAQPLPPALPPPQRDSAAFTVLLETL